VFLSVKDRLLGHKSVKINGVRITFKRLAPQDFLDSDGLFPFSIISDPSEKLKTNEAASEKMDNFRASIKAAISKAVVAPKLDNFLDELLKNENYMILFNEIFLFSIGAKKKLLILLHFHLLQLKLSTVLRKLMVYSQPRF
jgi:hypothetical protein